MKSSSLRRALVAGLAFVALAAGGSAHAAFRAFLSSAGVDNATCALATPCRLLPAALTAVDPRGEIWMLDSANFNTGPVAITKSVTILAIPGQLGSVVGISGTALSINGAGIEVTLQNLNILSFSNTGDIGVLVSNAKQVSIVNCNIFGFLGTVGQGNGIGVWVNPGANAPKVNVVASIVRNNSHGIIVAGNGRATISKSHVLGNTGTGVWSAAGALSRIAVVDVSDSVSSGNAVGFAATGTGSQANGFSYMNVIRSVATENTAQGFLANGGATGIIVVGDSMATSNAGAGFMADVGSEIGTRGNNTVIFNGVGITGTMSPVAGQ